MPTPIQTLLPPTPIQKSVQPKPAQPEPANDRDQDFQQALKTATKKATSAADQSQSTPKKPKAEKSAKEKPTTKTAGKSAKPKSTTEPQDTEVTEESTETPSEAPTDPTAPQAQLPIEEETQATTDPKPKPAANAKTDPDHPDLDPALANTAVAAHAVQPIDAKKDQHPDHPEQDEPSEDHPDQSPQATIQELKRNANVRVPLGAKPGATKPTVHTDQEDPTEITDDHAATTAPQSPQTPIPSPTKTNPDDQPATPANQPTQPTAKPAQSDPNVAPLGADPGPAIQPRAKSASTSKPTDPTAATDSTTDTAAAYAQLINPDAPAPTKSTDKTGDLTLDPLAAIAPDAAAPSHTAGGAPAQTAAAAANTPAPAPEVDFAQTNHTRIVSEVRGQLLPHGGTMQIRLDPPELGALKVMVEMRDGVMNATFQTSNENATQLLSHSLNQLKHVLESQGVSVERLQVQQAPKSEQATTQQDPDHQQQRDANDQHTAQQEQQRKELLQRMWRKVSGAGDPLDFLA